MAKGRKTGGRQKGVRNHRTEAQAAAIEASGLTPLEYMLSVLRDSGQDYEVRLEAAKSAAPYVHPRLANVELSGSKDKPLEVKVVRYSTTEPVGSATLSAKAVGGFGERLQESGSSLASPQRQG